MMRTGALAPYVGDACPYMCPSRYRGLTYQEALWRGSASWTNGAETAMITWMI